MIDNPKFVQNHLNDFLPKNFLNYFTKTINQYDYDTRGIAPNVPIINNTFYGLNSITLKAITEWNSV